MKKTIFTTGFAFMAFFITSMAYSQTVPCDSLLTLPREWGLKKSWVGYEQRLNLARQISEVSGDTCYNNIWISKALREYRYATEDTLYRYFYDNAGMRLFKYPKNSFEANPAKVDPSIQVFAVVITGGEEEMVDTINAANMELVVHTIKNAIHKTYWLDSLAGESKSFFVESGLLKMNVIVGSDTTKYVMSAQTPNSLYASVFWSISNNGGWQKNGKVCISSKPFPSFTQYDLCFDFIMNEEKVVMTFGEPRRVYIAEHAVLVDFFRIICSE